MIKKPTKKTLVKKADQLLSLYVRLRDKRCVTCGKTGNLTCGHLFSRSHYSTRWDLKNVYTQCWGCNFKHEHDPYPLTRYATLVWGEKEIEALHQRYCSPTHYKTKDLMGIVDTLKNLVSEVTDGTEI